MNQWLKGSNRDLARRKQSVAEMKMVSQQRELELENVSKIPGDYLTNGVGLREPSGVRDFENTKILPFDDVVECSKPPNRLEVTSKTTH